MDHRYRITADIKSVRGRYGPLFYVYYYCIANVECTEGSLEVLPGMYRPAIDGGNDIAGMETRQYPAAVGIGDTDPHTGIITKGPGIYAGVGEGPASQVGGLRLLVLQAEAKAVEPRREIGRFSFVNMIFKEGMGFAALADSRHCPFDVAIPDGAVIAKTAV